MRESPGFQALRAEQVPGAIQDTQNMIAGSTQNFDVVVVGSGLAGLAAARALALRGAKVAVLERNNTIGGHLLPFYRFEQVFEVGLHYIADCGAGSQWSRAVQALKIDLETIPLAANFEQIVLEPSNQKQSMPQGILSYLAHAQAQFPEHLEKWNRFAADLELVWRLANAQSFPLSAGGFLHSFVNFKGTRNKLRIARLLLTSAHEYFYRVLGLSQDAAEYCLTHHVLIGSHPKQLSALMYLLIHRYYFESPCFIKGGGESLVHALTAKVSDRSNGEVLFYKNFDVQSLCVLEAQGLDACKDAPRFKLASNVSSVSCRSVIWTPDPRILKAKARFELPTLLKVQLSRAKNPHALCVGYFGTLCELQELGFENANYWLKGTLTASQAYEEDDVLVLAAQAPLYLSTGSLRDPLAIRQNGCENLGSQLEPNTRETHKVQSKVKSVGARGVFQAMFLVPPSTEIWGGSNPDEYRLSETNMSKKGYRRSYLKLKNEALNILLQRLLKQFPLLEGKLCWKELGTPLTHHRYLHTESLGGYGFASTREDLLWARPGYRSGLKGLYLAGAHTKPSHGIVTCLLSGAGVGQQVATDLKIP